MNHVIYVLVHSYSSFSTTLKVQNYRRDSYLHSAPQWPTLQVQVGPASQFQAALVYLAQNLSHYSSFPWKDTRLPQSILVSGAKRSPILYRPDVISRCTRSSCQGQSYCRFDIGRISSKLVPGAELSPVLYRLDLIRLCTRSSCQWQSYRRFYTGPTSIEPQFPIAGLRARSLADFQIGS